MPDVASKSRKIPSIYQQQAAMEMAGGAPGAGPSPDQSKPGTAAGDSGKKVENVKVLLEVFKKMDSMETDPAMKDLIQRMSETAKEYMQKLEGGGGPGKTPTKEGEAPPVPPPGGPAGGPPGGEAGAPAPGATPVPA